MPSAGSASAPTNVATREEHHRDAMVERPRDHALVALRLAVEPMIESAEQPRDPAAAAPSAVCGSGQYADSIGSSENETNSDTSTEQTIVSANGLNHCPAIPPMNAIGMNTTTIDSVVAVTARPISSVPSNAALIVALPHLDVAHDVLAHHDRIVDEDADGERQPEQRHRVQREAERPDRDERRQDRHRQRQTGDDRRPPRVEEQEDDEHRERRAFDQRLLNAGDRVLDAHAGVAHDPQRHAGRQRASGCRSTRLRICSATAVVLKPLDLRMSMPTASSSL